jgi:hypothetical protein
MAKHNQQNKQGTPPKPAEENSTPERVEMFPKQEREPSIQIADLIRGGMHQAFEY